MFTQDLANTVARSVDADAPLSAALANTPDLPLPADLAANNLAAQMRAVARTALAAKRQVFFVPLSGFDTHDDQLVTQPALHTQLAGALSYFYSSLNALTVADQVTTFTASDFVRKLTSNGDGSDRGWGSHHFIMGGEVKGKEFYGTFPVMGYNNDDELGSGRLLPTRSVDQYAAMLAQWFGITSAADLKLVLPNIGGFSNTNLGFMT